MRKFLIAGAAALCCAAALPASAAPANNVVQGQTTAQDEGQQTTQQPRSRDASRRVCRTARMSQSRIPQRICRTQAEWDLDDATRN